jgi:hypothetical protein
MKKICTILFILIACANLNAQQRMSYQAIVRGASGELIIGNNVGMKISITQGSANGTVVYSETHSAQTNANGLTSLVIGDGTPVTGNINSIDWSNGPHFIKTEADPTGGTNYSITGTSPILGVPFSNYAQSSGTTVNNIPQVNGNITLTKYNIGLDQIDNTSDHDKPVSTAVQVALNAKANANSPIFSGTPTAPTATQGNISNQIATTQFVNDAVSATSVPDADDITKGKIALAGDLNGYMSSADAPVITDNAITTNKIADDNVTTDKILNGSITTDKISDASVTTDKINDNSVVTAKIADFNITTDKIIDNAITTDKIFDASINTDKLADASVTTDKIVDNNITTDKIADDNVTTAKIADNNITTDKIADDNVTTAKIADDNVTTDKIADNNITTAKIADDNVTTDKIADQAVTSDKIDVNTILGQNIQYSTITYDKIQDASASNVVLGRASAGPGTIEEINTTGSGDVVRAESPSLTGNPVAPTQTVTDNSTKIATTGFVKSAIQVSEVKEVADGMGLSLSVNDAGKIITTQWTGHPTIPENLPVGFSCTIINYSNSAHPATILSTIEYFTPLTGWASGTGTNTFNIKSGGTAKLTVIDIGGTIRYFVSGDLE